MNQCSRRRFTRSAKAVKDNHVASRRLFPASVDDHPPDSRRIGLSFLPLVFAALLFSVFAATSQTGERDFVLHSRPRVCSFFGESPLIPMQISNDENHFSRSDFRQARQ